MLQWVFEGASRAKSVEKVIVATDDERIVEMVEGIGCQAVMTSPHHFSGTDRVAEAIGDGEPDVIVNLQGDEPRIDPAAIDQLTELFEESGPNPPRMATLCHPLSPEEARDPSKVKVVFDNRFNALYFSRAAIPHSRDGDRDEHYLHVGIYAYTPQTLREFVALPPGRLEKLEKLEQLRALENGIPIRVAITSYRSFGVDTPEDAEKMDRLLREKHRHL
jgi:3-deoxy-manno-octulosonate cytidylyltransferase (CMP-KDO synthetase)